MGPSIAHGYPKALCRPDDNVGAPLPRGGEHGAGQQVCGYHHLGLGFLCPGNQILQHATNSAPTYDAIGYCIMQSVSSGALATSSYIAKPFLHQF